MASTSHQASDSVQGLVLNMRNSTYTVDFEMSNNPGSARHETHREGLRPFALQHDSASPPPAEKKGVTTTAHAIETRSSDAAHPTRQEALRAWILEYVCLVLAIACLVSIFKLLADANGQREENWKLRIGLNSLIAILSTIFRSSISQVSGEVISQLKWFWLREPHSLLDLQHFDEASRGPYGASLLGFRLKKLSFVQLGCFVTIVSYAIGPFTQQAIRTELCTLEIPNLSARIPLARGEAIGGSEDSITRFGAGLWALNGATKAAIVNAIANPNMNRTTLLQDCPTGNCTFPAINGASHSTLGFCSVCQDTTRQISEAIVENSNSSGAFRLRSELRLPNGQALSNQTFVAINVTTGRTIFRELDLSDELLTVSSVSVANISVLSYTSNGCKFTRSGNQNFWNCTSNIIADEASAWDKVNVVATACSIYPCERVYRAEVSNSVLEEKLQHTRPAIGTQSNILGSLPFAAVLNESCMATHTSQDISNTPEPRIIVDGSNYTAVLGSNNITIPAECLDMISLAYLISLEQSLEGFLSGTCFTPGNGFHPRFEDPDGRQRLLCYDPFSSTAFGDSGRGGWWNLGLNNKGNATYASISNHMQIVSDAITDRLRFESFSASNPATFAQGSVQQTSVCTRFVWQWLLLPAGLLLATAVFLLITAAWCFMARADVPLWKSSNLPLIFATAEDLRGSEPQSVSVMEDAAKGTSVVVEPDSANHAWLLRRHGGETMD